jgi:hypothetical protein
VSLPATPTKAAILPASNTVPPSSPNRGQQAAPPPRTVSVAKTVACLTIGCAEGLDDQGGWIRP